MSSGARSRSTDSPSLQIERRFEASPITIYRCFTEAEHLAQWFGPDGVSCRNVEVDAREGGEYGLELVNPDGTHIGLVGRFVEIDAPKLIKMTWRWVREGEAELGEETLVTLRFSAMGTGTLLRLVHERFADEAARDEHNMGWTSSLDCLEEKLELELESEKPRPAQTVHDGPTGDRPE